jgi:hypothetical protein
VIEVQTKLYMRIEPMRCSRSDSNQNRRELHIPLFGRPRQVRQVYKIPLYLRYPKTLHHPPCLHRVNRLCRKSHHLMAKFPTFSSQELLGGSSTENPLLKAKIGTILSPGVRRDGHSSVIFSKTSEWPKLARVNSPEQFSL